MRQDYDPERDVWTTLFSDKPIAQTIESGDGPVRNVVYVDSEGEFVKMEQFGYSKLDDSRSAFFLSDCVSQDPSVAELFIVQSGFAAEAKEMRDRWTQAVLPIGPSIIKVRGARLDRALDCEGVKSMIAALGVGLWFPRWQTAYDLSKLRYDKVILVMDGTPEGRHIREQVVTFFYRFNRPMLRAGHVYLAPAEWRRHMAEAGHHLVPLRAGRTLAETLAYLGNP